MDSGTSRQTARARSHSWEQRVSYARYTSGLTQLILKITCDTIDFQALSQAMPSYLIKVESIDYKRTQKKMLSDLESGHRKGRFIRAMRK